MESKITGSLTLLCQTQQQQQPPASSSAAGSSPQSRSSPGSSPSSKAASAATVAGSPSPAAGGSPVTSPGAGGNSATMVRSGSLAGMFPPPNCKCILAHHVVPFMDESSIVALMRSCKRAKEITMSDEVWEGRLKDMRVNVILTNNRTSGFFRAFRSEIVTLRGLEGTYDFESEENESSQGTNATGGTSPNTAVKRVVLTIAPAFLGFVTPVARVVLIVQYYGMMQQDVFEGTMRYSFPKRLFVMSTYLTRCPRQEGPRFDVVVARSMRKWGTQKPAHFDAVKGGTRLIISIAQNAQSPANGYLPSNELLTVSRAPRAGEISSPSAAPASGPLPMDAVGGGSGSPSESKSNPPSEKRFSLRNFLSGK